MPRVIVRAAVLPWIAPASADWRLAEGRDWLRRSLVCEVEQRRLFPWIPVCFGIGIILFFQAEEPALWAPSQHSPCVLPRPSCRADARRPSPL